MWYNLIILRRLTMEEENTKEIYKIIEEIEKR